MIREMRIATSSYRGLLKLSRASDCLRILLINADSGSVGPGCIPRSYISNISRVISMLFLRGLQFSYQRFIAYFSFGFISKELMLEVNL